MHFNVFFKFIVLHSLHIQRQNWIRWTQNIYPPLLTSSTSQFFFLEYCFCYSWYFVFERRWNIGPTTTINNYADNLMISQTGNMCKWKHFWFSVVWVLHFLLLPVVLVVENFAQNFDSISTMIHDFFFFLLIHSFFHLLSV